MPLRELAAEEVRRVRKAPLAILVLLVIGGAAGFGAGWFVASERIAVLTAQLDALKPPEPPRVDLELGCKREMRPAAPTYQDRLSVLRLNRGEAVAAIGQVWGVEPDGPGIPNIFRCQLVNRGNVPVMGVWLGVDVAFSAAVATGTSLQSGDIVEARDRSVLVEGAVLPNGQEPKVFWIENAADDFLQVSFRENVITVSADAKPMRVPIRIPARQ